MKKIITLKVVSPFHDIKAKGIRREKHTEFDCSMARAIEILSYKDKLVEILSIKNIDRT